MKIDKSSISVSISILVACIFENIKEFTDEEQSKAFIEFSKIEDRVTKIKIRIHRKKSIK